MAASGAVSLPFWFLMPESPRWLFVKGREEEAIKIVKGISKRNGIKSETLEKALEDLRQRSQQPMKCDQNEYQLQPMSHEQLLHEEVAQSDQGDGESLRHRHRQEKAPTPLTLKARLCGYPALRRNLLICLLVWFSFSVGYYGVVYVTPPLGFSPQLVFAFPAFFTLPLVMVSPLAENRLGRRPVIAVGLGIGGVAAVATLAVPLGM